MTSPELPDAVTPRSAMPTWRGYVRRGGPAFVACVVIALLAAVLVTALMHKRYSGTTRVLVTPTLLDTVQTAGGQAANTVNLDTQAQLVTSRSVIGGAGDLYPALRRRSYKDIVASIAVTVPANTTVLEITFTGDTPAGAEAGANAIATAYLADRQGSAQGLLTRQINAATGRADNLSKRLESLSVQRPTATNRAFIDSQLTLVRSQLNSANALVDQLNNQQVTPGRVVAPANRPTAPSSPSKLLNLASALALGLMLGVAVAWWLTRYRRTLRTADDAAYLVDAPCLAVLGSLDRNHADTAVAYRRLALMAATHAPDPLTLAVTTPADSAVTARVAGGIAAALADNGVSAALLQVRSQSAEADLPAGFHSRRAKRTGALVTDAGSLAMALVQSRASHDALVVDVPGATTSADAQTIGAQVGAVLVVVESGTRTDLVHETVAQLDRVGAPLLGTVLVARGAGGLGPGARRGDRTTTAPTSETTRAGRDLDDGIDYVGARRSSRDALKLGSRRAATRAERRDAHRHDAEQHDDASDSHRTR